MNALDPDLAELREITEQRGLAPLPQISVVAARERVCAGNSMCAAGPEVESVVDFEISTSGRRRVPVRLYRHGAASDVMVYAHGGAWFTGDLDYADEFCRFLAHDAHCVVLSVDYRLAPEDPWPAPLADLYAAIRWAADELASDGALGVAGDSAGGNLAAAAAVLCEREDGPRLDFQALVYPVLDADLDRPSYQRPTWPLRRPDMAYAFDLYVPDEEQRAEPTVSPLSFDDPAAFPRTLLVVAGHDPLHDEAMAFASKLIRAGTAVDVLRYDTLAHGFLRFTGAVPAAARARDEIVDHVSKLLKNIGDPARSSGPGGRT